MICISSSTERPLRMFQLSLLSSVLLALTACGADSGSSTDGVQPASTAPGEPSGNASDDAGQAGSTQADRPVASLSTVIGEVLVSVDDDLTLYTFANDEPGVSNCNDGCAIDWPPILASESAETGDFGTIIRSDETLQWAFKGSPLYHYAGDGAGGEINGEGLGGVWFVARPDPVSTGTTSLGPVLVARDESTQDLTTLHSAWSLMAELSTILPMTRPALRTAMRAAPPTGPHSMQTREPLARATTRSSLAMTARRSGRTGRNRSTSMPQIPRRATRWVMVSAEHGRSRGLEPGRRLLPAGGWKLPAGRMIC